MRDDIKISRANNGFIVTYPPDDEESSDAVFVYQDRDSWDGPNQDPGPVAEMFYDMVDHFGAWGSKHDAERLSIRVVKREQE